MIFYRARANTSHLSQNPVTLSVQRQNRYRRLMLGCLLMLLLILSADRFCSTCQLWPWWPGSLSGPAHASAIAAEHAQKQEHDHLQKEIDDLLLEQQIQTAVRQKLEQQITDLQAQLKAVELQLDFFTSSQVDKK